MMKKQDTYQNIVSVAEHLIQTVGYNAFSYHDIANKIGIKTASIHYHFPVKADLGKAVIKNHIEALCIRLDELIQNKKISSAKKLELFIETIITNTYRAENKMCLGGMLASDILTLPKLMQSEVKLFFQRIEDWLKQLLQTGIENKEFILQKKYINDEVKLVFSLLEGALLLSRLFEDEAHLIVAKNDIMKRLTKG